MLERIVSMAYVFLSIFIMTFEVAVAVVLLAALLIPLSVAISAFIVVWFIFRTFQLSFQWIGDRFHSGCRR